MGDDSSSCSSNSTDNNEIDGVVSWRSCFHERFPEEILIPKEARLTDESRDRSAALIAVLDQEIKDGLKSRDELNDQAWIQDIVEDVIARFVL